MPMATPAQIGGGAPRIAAGGGSCGAASYPHSGRLQDAAGRAWPSSPRRTGRHEARRARARCASERAAPPLLLLGRQTARRCRLLGAHPSTRAAAGTGRGRARPGASRRAGTGRGSRSRRAAAPRGSPARPRGARNTCTASASMPSAAGTRDDRDRRGRRSRAATGASADRREQPAYRRGSVGASQSGPATFGIIGMPARA